MTGWDSVEFELNIRDFRAGDISCVDRDRFRNGFVLVSVVGNGSVGGFGGTAGAGNFVVDVEGTGGSGLRVSRDGFRE